MKRLLSLSVLVSCTILNADVSTELTNFSTSLNALASSLGGSVSPAPAVLPSAADRGPVVAPPQPQPAPVSPPPAPAQPTTVVAPPPMPTTLAPAPAQPGMGGVLGQIQQGVHLRKKTSQPTEPSTPAGPSAEAGMLGELKGVLGRRQTAKTPSAPAQPGTPATAPERKARVKRGKVGDWTSLVELSKDPVNWQAYNLSNYDSKFGNAVHYSLNAANKAIFSIKQPILKDAKKTQQEGIILSRGHDQDLKGVLSELLTSFQSKVVSQENISMVTEDNRGSLLNALLIAINIAPVSVSRDVVKNAVKVIELEGQYKPARIFSALADSYVGGAVAQLRAEIDREIRNRGMLDLQGVTEFKRQSQLKAIGRKMTEALNRLNNIVHVYETFKDHEAIALLDKDLLLGKLICSWNMIEGMYHELQAVLTPAEYPNFQNQKNKGFVDVNVGTVDNVLIHDYITSTGDGLNALMLEHERPVINVLQTLEVIAELSAEHRGIFLNFILDNLPELPEGNKPEETDISPKAEKYRQKEALLQAFLECHYDMYNTDEKLQAVQASLQEVIDRIDQDQGQEGVAKGRVQAIKDRLIEYRQEVIRNKEVKELMQRIYTDPEISANPEKIKKVITDLSVMVQRKDIELKEAEDLVKVLQPEYDKLAYAKEIAKGLIVPLMGKICRFGAREQIIGEINTYIYAKDEYKNPSYEAVTISINERGDLSEKKQTITPKGADLKLMQNKILESAVALALTYIYLDKIGQLKDNLEKYGLPDDFDVFCLRCSYNAAWLIARDLTGLSYEIKDSYDYNQALYPDWVNVIVGLPYNVDGNKDSGGLPDRGSWFDVVPGFIENVEPLMSEELREKAQG